MNQRAAADRLLFYRTLLRKRTLDSSVPLERFCRKHGISPWTFYYWKRRLGEKDTVYQNQYTPPTRPSFVPISVTPAQEGSGFMEVQLREGIVIRFPGGFDKEIFRAIIETVSSAGDGS
jgi:hypothetical protein